MALVTSFPASPASSPVATASSNGLLASIPRTKPPADSKLSTNNHAARRNRPKLSETSALSDIQISFPGTGRIRFSSELLFSDSHSALAREFFERAFLAPEVDQVEIGAGRRKAEISFRTTDDASNRVSIKKISQFLAQGRPSSDTSKPLIFPATFAESSESLVRLCRHGQRLSGWALKHELEGRIRLQNPALFRKRELCEAIERELMNAFGVYRYSTNDLTSSVLIYYDPQHI